MDDAGLSSKLDKPAPVAANGLEMFTVGFGDLLDRSSSIFSATLNAGLRFAQTEAVRLVEEATADNQAIFARLWGSKSPLDVLAAEQEWMRARSRSVLGAGVRFVDAVAAASRVAKAEDRPEPARTKRDVAA